MCLSCRGLFFGCGRRAASGWYRNKTLVVYILSASLLWAQNASSLAIAAPTRLSGVEAPDVRPTDHGSGRKPVCRRHFGLRARGPVTDLESRYQTVGVGDVEGGARRCTNPRQITGIAAVISSDHDHQVDRSVVQQRDHGILAVLRRTANRVERLEVARQILCSVAFQHRGLQHFSRWSSDSDISIVV